MKTSSMSHFMRSAALLALLALATVPARAIINNGGFESGFAGWSIADQTGSDGTFFIQSGTLSPVNGQSVPAPPEGLFAAMSDAQGPGAHVLYQDFTVPSITDPMRLTFDLFIGNRAPDFVVPDPATLDFATPAANQQVRVDIMLASADPFSVDPNDILLTVFQTLPGQPLVSGYNHYSTDITSILSANLNTPLRLRFAEIDNVFTFQLGVDNVAIQAAVPETLPIAPALFLSFAGLCALRHLRSRTPAQSQA